jgi:hypothetical protein
MKRGRQEGPWTFLYTYSLRVFRDGLPAVKCGRKSDHLGRLCQLLLGRMLRGMHFALPGIRKPPFFRNSCSDTQPVLRIHVILVWIRIRIWIRGSMPLTNGSGCLLPFEGTFTSFFKDKKSKRSHKAVGIKIFLTIFAC